MESERIQIEAANASLVTQRSVLGPVAVDAMLAGLHAKLLCFPKFKLSAADREELLADDLPHCRSVRIPARLPTLPECRDPHDQMFIELAVAGKADVQADFLVTGDKDLLVLTPAFGRRIVTAEAFLAGLGPLRRHDRLRLEPTVTRFPTGCNGSVRGLSGAVAELVLGHEPPYVTGGSPAAHRTRVSALKGRQPAALSTLVATRSRPCACRPGSGCT